MKQQENAASFDPRMAAEGAAQQLAWSAIPAPPVQVLGLGFFERERAWNRLPQSLLPVLRDQRPAMVQLAAHTAGAALLFCTDSPEIWVRAALCSPPYMSHMAPTAQCGFDCYVRGGHGERWQLAGVSKFEIGRARLCARLAQRLPGPVQVLVHLPLYVGVEQLELGLAPGARLWAAPRPQGPAAAFYGTSITQGGCATRPGMAYPAILQRMLGTPMYNFGFSGNGVGLACLAPVLCALPDLGLLVVDIEANAGPEGLLPRNLPLFLDAVRACRPRLPVLVLGGTLQAQEAWDPAFAQQRAGWASLQRSEVERRRAAGDCAVWYADVRPFLNELEAEATVDGVHLTDLGFYCLAQGLAPLVRGLLGGEAPGHAVLQT